MHNSLKDKIEDFTGWCLTAFTHYKNGYFADSLTNMRKSGEAACKLMVIFKYPQKIAEDKIAQKSYKELIELIIKENLASRKAINWLEALQIHGNMATHDGKVEREQAHYSIAALKMLIQWLFTDNLKIQIPASLKKAIAADDNKATAIVSEDKRLVAELNKIINDKKELEAALQAIKGKSEEENASALQLSHELQKATLRIEELEQSRARINSLEQELATSKKETLQWQQMQTVPAVEEHKKPFITRNRFLTLFVCVVAISAIWLVVKNFNNNPVLKEEPQLLVQKDTFSVLLLPLSILQDNPNIKIKFEEALLQRLGRHVIDNQLSMRLNYDTQYNKPSVSMEEAVEEGLRKKADLVIYGELYEPAGADSTQVNIKYTLTRKNNRVNGEVGVLSFLKLTDSACINIQRRIETIVNFGMAETYIFKRKYSEALVLLNQTPALSDWAKISLYSFKGDCYLQLKNYPAAIKETEKLIALQPKSSYPYFFMGGVLKAQGKMALAEPYYQKALRIEPSNVNTLLNYAEALVSKELNRPAKAKEIVLEALKYDSTVVLSWKYLGDIQGILLDFKGAQKSYVKVLQLDTANILAKRELAQLLAFNFNQPQKAVSYLSQVLAKDSTDSRALFILASIYNSTSMYNPVQAAYLFKKSKENGLVAGSVYADNALGVLAYDKGDFKEAERLLLKVYEADSSNQMVCSQLGEVYRSLGDFKKGLRFIQRGYQLDSLNFYSNYNLGYYYYTNNNPQKGRYYLERALKTTPEDILTLEYLGSIYMASGEVERARPLYQKLYKLNPKSFMANKTLGTFADGEQNTNEALMYYRQANNINPNDAELNINLALALVTVSAQKNIADALHYGKHALELNPNSPEIMYVYAKILYIARDNAKAMEYYYKALALRPALKDPQMEKLFLNK